MKTTPVSILLAGILGTQSALAEVPPPGKERPERGTPGRGFSEAWKIADENGDHALSLSEFSSMPRLQAIPDDKRELLFQRLDKDGNELISREEMQQIGPPRPDGAKHRKRLWELDSDQSGGITREEFSAGEMFKKLPPERQQKLFARLDSNQDGTISPEDRPESSFSRPEDHPARQEPGDGDFPRQPFLFSRLDANNDGSVDFSEFAKMPGISRLGEDDQERAFEKIDTNRDLALSPEEMKASRPLNHKKGKGPDTDGPLNPPPSSPQ